MGIFLRPCGCFSVCLWLAHAAECVAMCVHLGVLPLLAEGEIESQWLQDTGLSGLLGGLGLDSHPRRLLSTLTQTQVAAVCRRLEIYNRSARRRHKAPVRDVRDIFGGFNSGVSKWHEGHCRPCLPGPVVVSPRLKGCRASAAGLCWCMLAYMLAWQCPHVCRSACCVRRVYWPVVTVSLGRPETSGSLYT